MDYLPAVARHQVNVIYLHIVENDLRHWSEGQIANELLSLVDDVYSLCNTVIVGQLTSFPATQHQFPDTIRDINNTLRRDLPAGRVFWCHQFRLVPCLWELSA